MELIQRQVVVLGEDWGEAGGIPDLNKLPKSALRNRNLTTTKQLHKYLFSSCDKPGAKLMPVYT